MPRSTLSILTTFTGTFTVGNRWQVKDLSPAGEDGEGLFSIDERREIRGREEVPQSTFTTTSTLSAVLRAPLPTLRTAGPEFLVEPLAGRDLPLLSEIGRRS